VLTRTEDPASWPFNLGSVVAGVLGELGDPSPHAEARVPRAAQHAPAQNWRRDTTMLVSDIVIPCDWGAELLVVQVRQDRGHLRRIDGGVQGVQFV
jgi:hypothetical protein